MIRKSAAQSAGIGSTDCLGLELRDSKKGQRGIRIQPSGRAFLQNKSDRSCIPQSDLGGFFKSIPPKDKIGTG